MPTVSVSRCRRHVSATAHFPATARVAGVSGRASSSLEGVNVARATTAGPTPVPRSSPASRRLPLAPSAAGCVHGPGQLPRQPDYTSRPALANFTIAAGDADGDRHRRGRHLQRHGFAATDTVTGVSGVGRLQPRGGQRCRWRITAGPTPAPPQLTGLTPLSAAPTVGRPVHGAGQLRRQHRLHQRLGAGQLHHRPGDADGERRRRGRHLQRHGFAATDTVDGSRAARRAPASRGSACRWPTTAGPTPAPRSSPASPRCRPRRAVVGAVHGRWPASPAAPTTPAPRHWPTSRSPRRRRR